MQPKAQRQLEIARLVSAFEGIIAAGVSIGMGGLRPWPTGQCPMPLGINPEAGKGRWDVRRNRLAHLGLGLLAFGGSS